MKTGMSINIPARILSSAALCILVLSSSGCLQHRASTADGYRIEDKWNVPRLVPIAVQGTTSEKRQTVVIILPAGRSETKRQVHSDCTINGTIFSLDRSSGSNERSWVVRGPSVSGWETLSGEVDIHAQWNIFLRDLARIHDEGAFHPVSAASLYDQQSSRRSQSPLAKSPGLGIPTRKNASSTWYLAWRSEFSDSCPLERQPRQDQEALLGY